MDIFGKKRNKVLEQEVSQLKYRVEMRDKTITDLRKPIEDHKNRYRTFVVSMRRSPDIKVRCRRFDHNLNGYYFYEVDKSSCLIGYAFVENEGYLVGHMSNNEVWKVFEEQE
jgi:xanthine dehydrogenase iron-sulfur cluster and FAD-binding subunit A